MFNQITILGRVGTDPVYKNTKTGSSMCSFSVAVNNGYGDSKVTNWYSVTVFGKLADTCEKYVKKGNIVCVAGSLVVKDFEAKDGTKKYRLELTANNVTFLKSQEQQDSPQHVQQEMPAQNSNPFIDEEPIPF